MYLAKQVVLNVRLNCFALLTGLKANKLKWVPFWSMPADRGNGSQQEQISKYLIPHCFHGSIDRLEMARVKTGFLSLGFLKKAKEENAVMLEKDIQLSFGGDNVAV